MKALILNSGTGSRMGTLTEDRPKCMVPVAGQQTIISRQLSQLKQHGIKQVVLTTGPFAGKLEHHCNSLGLGLDIQFVHNPRYAATNYIYSIFLARQQLGGSLIMIHGDLVFEDSVLTGLLEQTRSCMAVSSVLPLPQKDFKAVIKEDRITKIGIEFFDNALAAQPLYRLDAPDWRVWLDSIEEFCQNGQTGVYAENAFNAVSQRCALHPYDFGAALCAEIDTPQDLREVSRRIK